MNINFKEQPEPQLTQRGMTARRAQAQHEFGKGSYFVCRHSPHPRTVCHIKGLNDAPICVVKDPGYGLSHFIIPGIEQGLPNMQSGAAAANTSVASNAILPNLPHYSHRGKGLPPPVPLGSRKSHGQSPTSDEYQLAPRSQSRGKRDFLREEISELTKKAANTPLLKRKDDPLRKYLGDRPATTTTPEIHPYSPAHARRYRPEIKDNVIYTPYYLDQEIKILEKLRDILQTDSIAQIQDWLSKATLKEKEFVSHFIRSDMTSRDLLNYQQRAQDENEAEILNLQAIMKGAKARQKGLMREEKCFRTSSQGSVASKGTRQERPQEGNLLTRREKISIPCAENLPLEHSSTRQRCQEINPNSTPLSQTSNRLQNSKASTRQLHRIPREDDSLPSL